LNNPKVNEDNKPKVVTTGLFTIVRHPCYFFGILAGALTTRMTVDSVIIGVYIFLYFVIAIPSEERKLIQKFGKEYEDYQKTTPMILPNPVKIFKMCFGAKAKPEWVNYLIIVRFMKLILYDLKIIEYVCSVKIF